MSGCGSAPQWEIVVENTGSAPCSVHVTLGYSGGGSQGTEKASVEAVSLGETHALLIGDSPRTIQSIRIVRGEEEELIESKTEIQPGGRFVIVVPAEGEVSASLE